MNRPAAWINAAIVVSFPVLCSRLRARGLRRHGRERALRTRFGGADRSRGAATPAAKLYVTGALVSGTLAVLSADSRWGCTV